jgi:hypothetical protein
MILFELGMNPRRKLVVGTMDREHAVQLDV